MNAAVRVDRRSDALAALAAVRPALGVVAEPERLAAFEMDAYIQKRATPLAAVLPRVVYRLHHLDAGGAQPP